MYTVSELLKEAKKRQEAVYDELQELLNAMDIKGFLLSELDRPETWEIVRWLRFISEDHRIMSAIRLLQLDGLTIAIKADPIGGGYLSDDGRLVILNVSAPPAHVREFLTGRK